MIAMAAGFSRVESTGSRMAALPRRPSSLRRAIARDSHDLPVLAAEHSPRVRLDWERLMAEGAPPCLVLGAERRLRGSR